MGNTYSALKIFHHKELLDAIEQGKQIAPIYIRLKPTNLCNHHCSYCSYGTGNDGSHTSVRDDVQQGAMIPWEKLQEIIGDMGSMGVRAMTFSGGGEPLTYPHILEAISMLRERGIARSVITNGQLLCGAVSESLRDARWVRVSFDSPNPEEYSALRGIPVSSFHTVVENIRRFARIKDADCVLGVNFVVGKKNAHQVYEAAEFLKDLGVDNVKFSAVVDNSKGYHKEIKDSVIEQIHRAQARLADVSFAIINSYESEWMDRNFTPPSFPHCYTARLVTVIAADCKIYTCHNRAYDSAAVLGDLSKASFRATWFSKELQERLLNICPPQDCCNMCTFAQRNVLMQSYFDVDKKHMDFI